jgi:putative PIN family toxin of toxin-antitoxin system
LRAVLDPNVLVSGAISSKGPTREILHRWTSGAFELVVSAEILFELQEVLSRPKFRRYLTLEEVRGYVLWLHDRAAEVSGELSSNVVQGVTADPDDDYIAGVAYLGEADVIVSGDPHLTDLDAIRRGDGGVIACILTPRTLLDELDREV